MIKFLKNGSARQKNNQKRKGFLLREVFFNIISAQGKIRYQEAHISYVKISI